MAMSSDPPVEERVARLEARVETLHTLVRQLADAVQRRGATVTLPTRPTATSRPDGTESAKPIKPVAFREFVARQGSEFWLNKIGIALLLFGVIFLFKYAVDQGWLTPWVRVAVGLAVGVTLYTLGTRLQDRQRWFATTLLGGAIAAFHITGYSAFQLYGLVSYPVAYAFMVAVSVLAVSSALRKDEATLSVISVIGALATPFLLFTGARNVPALMTYTSIVVVATAMVYLMKGWPALLWTTVFGTWVVLFTPVRLVPPLTVVERWALVGAALVAWIAFWAVPVVREALVMTQPDRWRRPTSLRSFGRHVEILTVGMPLLVLYHVAWVIAPPAATHTIGWLAVLAAAVFAAASWVLYSWRTDGRLWYAHAASSVILMTVALGILLEGGWLLTAWAAEVAALHYVAERTNNRTGARGAHVLFIVVAAWLYGRLGIEVGDRSAIVAVPALHDLMVIGAGFAAAHVMPPDPSLGDQPLGTVVPQKAVYRIVAYVALLGWLWRELSVLPNGNGLVTVAWGLLGAGLLVAALVARRVFMRRVAFGTLLAVVGKLFLVDLASVDALWRIMLFLGFGAIFLVLSYYFRNLWHDTADSPVD